MGMKPEKQEAIELANKVLDRINSDPDDDLAMLSRQFLRAIEREQSWITDRLPDDDETVLVYTPQGHEPVWPGFHGALFEDEKPGWHYANGDKAPDVTAWMPMPHPDKGGNAARFDDVQKAYEAAKVEMGG